MAYNIIADIGEYTLNSSNYSATNKCVIMTLDNILLFCDDVNFTTYTANTTILTLPNSIMFPSKNIYFPAIVFQNNSNSFRVFYLTPNGELKMTASLTSNGIMRLNGVCINICDKFYNPTIGNIYNNGTSPLSEH